MFNVQGNNKNTLIYNIKTLYSSLLKHLIIATGIGQVKIGDIIEKNKAH